MKHFKESLSFLDMGLVGEGSLEIRLMQWRPFWNFPLLKVLAFAAAVTFALSTVKKLGARYQVILT